MSVVGDFSRSSDDSCRRIHAVHEVNHASMPGFLFFLDEIYNAENHLLGKNENRRKYVGLAPVFVLADEQRQVGDRIEVCVCVSM